MKNKKGFTLIELLAVIVILAIIMVIAIPKILDVITNSKESAAKSSAELYIDTVEKYSVFSSIKNTTKLVPGTYKVAEQNDINGVLYSSVNDIVKMKGSMPTAGSITITNHGKVSEAKLCVNSYVVEYNNRKAKVVSDNCESLGIYPVFSISSIEWEQSKTLTITFPEGSYTNYFKLVSGNATYDSDTIELNKDIKVSGNTIEIQLTDNSEVVAWIMRDSKKISERTYIEEKIDNVTLPTIKAATTSSMPTLTEYGVKLTTQLTLTYEKQEGTSVYYSLDDGKTWIKYEGETTISGVIVKAKAVRDVSKIESNVISSKISVQSGAIGVEGYDPDEASYASGQKINISEEMQGKSIETKVKCGYAFTASIYSADGTELSKSSYSSGTKVITIPIPENAAYLLYGTSYISTAYIKPNNAPEINMVNTYPLLTTTGVTPSISTVTINYFQTATQKLYKIDDGEWKTYTGPFTIGADKTITAMSIDAYDEESTSSSKETTIPELAIGANGYDPDETTFASGQRIDISEEMIGHSLETKIKCGYAFTVFIYSADGTELLKSGYSSGTRVITLTIPENAAYLLYGTSYISTAYIKPVLNTE